MTTNLSMTKLVRPAVKWHGGKRYLAHCIIELMPQHHRGLSSSHALRSASESAASRDE